MANICWSVDHHYRITSIIPGLEEIKNLPGYPALIIPLLGIRGQPLFEHLKTCPVKRLQNFEEKVRQIVEQQTCGLGLWIVWPVDKGVTTTY